MCKFLRPVRLLALVLALCLLIPCFGSYASAADEADAAEAPAGITASWVRYGAKFSGTVIGCLENGTKITVLSSTKYFYKIDCFDMKGYIAKEQVIQDEEGNYIVRCLASSSETTVLPTVSAEEVLSQRSVVKTYSAKFKGVKYVWGGTSPRGFDCSGFTQYVFKHAGFALNRNCNNQMRNGVIIAKEDMQCGDLIFFENTQGNKNQVATHVGIYIGNGKMIHAGSKGIAIVDLSNSYYENHYLCARRVILTDTMEQTLPVASGVNQNINSSFWRDNLPE